jgi:hypothetical protein
MHPDFAVRTNRTACGHSFLRALAHCDEEREGRRDRVRGGQALASSASGGDAVGIGQVSAYCRRATVDSSRLMLIG